MKKILLLLGLGLGLGLIIHLVWTPSQVPEDDADDIFNEPYGMQ